MIGGIMALHITGGSLAIASGYAALFARKGGRLHRRAGVIFVFAMLVMGAGALVVGLARGAATWAGGPFVAYLVITAATTVRRSNRPAPWFDRTLTGMALALAAIFLVMGVQAAGSPGAQLKDVPAAAFFLNGTVALLAFLGDVRVLRIGPLTGNRRLARHLWRMCFAMFIATGSFFLGQAEVIPRPLRVTPVLMVLAVLPLVFLFYWMWRVRRRRDAYWPRPANLTQSAPSRLHSWWTRKRGSDEYQVEG